VDYDVVDWEYLSQGEAYSINQNEDIWEKYNVLFDVAKDYGVPPAVILEAADDAGGYDDFQEFMENGYHGEYDSIEDYAYDLIDDIGLTDDLAKNYFDYSSFGRTLESEGFAYSMTMEDWEDRYDTELEAQAAYDELSRLRPNELAEYYIFDVVGDLESALTSDQIKQYFDWRAFARDLGYDGYYEVTAGADTYIFRSFWVMDITEEQEDLIYDIEREFPVTFTGNWRGGTFVADPNTILTRDLVYDILDYCHDHGFSVGLDNYDEEELNFEFDNYHGESVGYMK